jgi:hypothetical protein
MYTITFNDFQVQCQSADEVRALCNSSTNGIDATAEFNLATGEIYKATTKPARKYRRKAADQRGSKMAARWAKARSYAKRHDVTPSEAFKIISK